jgi:hypothetical protein
MGPSSSCRSGCGIEEVMRKACRSGFSRNILAVPNRGYAFALWRICLAMFEAALGLWDKLDFHRRGQGFRARGTLASFRVVLVAVASLVSTVALPLTARASLPFRTAATIISAGSWPSVPARDPPPSRRGPLASGLVATE